MLGQVLPIGSSVASGHYALPSRIAKRVLDLLVVFTVAPVAVPLAMLLAVACWRVHGRPFFGHRRIGRDGSEFWCWKLRTMADDADAVLAAHLAGNPAAAREWAERRKLRRDPRVTRLGSILRALSLDELPQFFNVLRGEMSIVGPRPITAEELRRYGAAAPAYLRLTPGITGLWQVSGRNGLTFDDRIALDKEYARTRSLWRDLAILLRTVPAVLGRTGC